eukprot:snap_masked-scaffold_1-processed-gene-22.25-mRNA-1 protein AED:1.00 eAED:1.00 QI:0/-1/0/0/-1/1/1/0/93
MEFSENPTADTMAMALMRWQMELRFAEQFYLITDNGSHFANQLVGKLVSNIGSQQKNTVKCPSWLSGSVETVNSQILRILALLTSEIRLYQAD